MELENEAIDRIAAAPDRSLIEMHMGDVIRMGERSTIRKCLTYYYLYVDRLTNLESLRISVLFDIIGWEVGKLKRLYDIISWDDRTKADMKVIMEILKAGSENGKVPQCEIEDIRTMVDHFDSHIYAREYKELAALQVKEWEDMLKAILDED